MKRPCTARSDPAARLRKRLPRRYRYVRLRWRAFFAVVDILGGLLFGLFRFLAGPRVQVVPIPRRILVVQLDHLGDAILTTPLLEGLAACYPQATIEVLAGSANAGWFAMLPSVKRIHVLEANRFSREGRRGWVRAVFSCGLKMRARRFDLAIDVRGDFPVVVLMWLSGARRRVGWDSGGGGFLLTDSSEYVPNRHEIDSRRALLGCIVPGIEPAKPAFVSVRRRFAASPIKTPYPTVLAHISAGTEAKRWPAPYWRELVTMLDGNGVKVVLVGGTDALIIRDHVCAGTVWTLVEDRVGRTDLSELARLAASADAVVGADSAIVHLAAALGVPAVALFSGTNRSRQWRPRGKKITVLRHRTPCMPCHLEHCPMPEHACMKGIFPKAVFEAVVAAIQPTETTPVPKPASGPRPIILSH